MTDAGTEAYCPAELPTGSTPTPDPDDAQTCSMARKSIETAIDDYYAANNAWPNDVDDLSEAGLLQNNPLDLEIVPGTSSSDRPSVSDHGNTTDPNDC